MSDSSLERPYDRDNDHAEDQRENRKRHADLDIVHEAELTGAEDKGVRRRRNGGRECAGSRDADCHDNGVGEAPMDSAIEMPIGASSAAAAVFDMNCVRPHERMNIAATMTSGEGASPMRPTTKSAMSLPAPL